ncbi:c-type cytochrome [Rubritalea spongiae]|uniref:C-type cytochrome n=1 Tax=Rubritalea spongiae TaxID=430797 RepID=A0ABW5DYD8_9BACT
MNYLKSITFGLGAALCLSSVTAVAADQPKKKKKRGPRPAPAMPHVAQDSVHPFFALEDLDVLGGDELKIGGMCFHEGALYVASFAPDRTNQMPDHNGKLLRVDNIAKAGKDGEKIKITVLADGLYEPCSVGVVGDSIYVGEKTRIIRFDGGTKKDSLDVKEATVVVDGTSTINFHTYTIGFEPYMKDGKQYLCGNFTTAILLGGKRDKMIPPNPAVHRGSHFIFGPLTGSEDPKQVGIQYLAGGFRTPNGVEVGPENESYVADNQGIFNPSNKLIRITPGSFYGHYLYNSDGGKAAAFQPAEVEPENGDVHFVTPPTVHLPQNEAARSPAQPHVIRDRKGVLEPYNGQILLCEFTMGRVLRVFTEEVDGVWQGVAFKHSGGKADKNGANGFTGGPNRIEVGPDGNYYIGQIGAGRLWEFNGSVTGLQRFRVKAAEEVPADFNEILTVKVADGGFIVEFLKPISKDSIKLEDIAVETWTYQSTKSYGGAPVGKVKLKPNKMEFDESGKRLRLYINGLKDASPQYVIENGSKSSANMGWVVNVKMDPKKDGKSLLYTDEFWYTLLKKKGGKDAGADDVVELTAHEQAELKFQSLCGACHREMDNGWGAPNLAGIIGREQVVIRDGKEVKVTVDRNYLVNAIMNPLAEKPKEFKDGAMPPLGFNKEDAEAMVDYILTLK